jgi:outer membrane protein assembly factor BamB
MLEPTAPDVQTGGNDDSLEAAPVADEIFATETGDTETGAAGEDTVTAQSIETGQAASAVCSVCGKENRPDAAFCAGCASSLAGASAGMTVKTVALPVAFDEPFQSTDDPSPEPTAGLCGTCGLQIRPGSRFCKGCGASLAAASIPATQPIPGQSAAKNRNEKLLPFFAMGAVILAIIVAGGAYFMTRGDSKPSDPVVKQDVISSTPDGPAPEPEPTSPVLLAKEPTFRANAQHTGVYGTEKIAQPVPVWGFATGARVFSSPTIEGETVYCGSNDSNLFALNAATGTEKWRITTGDVVGSSPAVAGANVYFGSWDGSMYAANKATGVLLWKFPTGNSVGSSPTVVSGTVYFGSWDGNLYAVDAQTGSEKWRFRTGDKIYSSPAVDGNYVYTGSNDGYLYAINTTTGSQQWKYYVGGKVSSSPAVADNTVFMGSEDNNLYAVDAVSGKQKWKFRTGHRVNSSPAVSNGIVYFGSDDFSLYAVDVDSGVRKWAFATGAEVYASPSVTGDTVCFGSNDGNVYALDANSGGELWRFKTGDIINSSPAIDKGVVYIGSGDKIIYRLGA